MEEREFVAIQLNNQNTKAIDLLVITLILICNCGCSDQATNLIKQNLNSRFTKYKIVVIMKDSASVDQAANTYNEIKIKMSELALECQKAEMHFYGYNFNTNTRIERWSIHKSDGYMDSVTAKIVELCDYFLNLRFSKEDNCFYVKYRILDGPYKFEKDEYFYISRMRDITHRPANWNEYLKEIGAENLLDDCLGPRVRSLQKMLHYRKTHNI